MASIPQTHQALSSEIGRAQRMLISWQNKRVRAERAARRLPAGRHGLELRNQTIVQNLGLVRQIGHRVRGMGTPFEDLVQEGAMEGLRRAIELFDPKKGQLSTYAAPWIRQAMIRARTVQGATIIVPIHTREAANRLFRLAAQLANELGRDPTPEELSQRGGLPVDKVNSLLGLPKVNSTLHELLRRDDDDKETRLDRVVDEASPNAETENINLDRLDAVKGALIHLVAKGKISVRDLKIFIELFDLERKHFPGKPASCVEVGKRFNLTRERIRQIKILVLERIRQYLISRSTFS